MDAKESGVIGKNIVHLRKQKKWSQERLSMKLDISRARIGSYEEHRCDPGIPVLIKIADLFNISIDELVRIDLSKRGY